MYKTAIYLASISIFSTGFAIASSDTSSSTSNLEDSDSTVLSRSEGGFGPLIPIPPLRLPGASEVAPTTETTSPQTASRENFDPENLRPAPRRQIRVPGWLRVENPKQCFGGCCILAFIVVMLVFAVKYYAA